MIISMTGMPCSGKTVVIQHMVKKYGFVRVSGGDMYRKVAVDRGIDVLELNRISDTSVDKMVDEEIIKVGKERFYDNVIFDSRTAWHFVPKSFKVFLVVDEDEQAKRLLGTNRDSEKHYESIEEAKWALNERWELENKRYQNLYGFDNKNLNQYDLVVDTTNRTIEDVADLIYQEYLKYYNLKV